MPSLHPSIRHTLRLCVALTPLCLTACGDGWVTQPYHGVPYDGRGIESDDRTAGYGVEYVRASMLPAKTENTQAISAPAMGPPEQKAPPKSAEPIRSAEPLYNKSQKK